MDLQALFEKLDTRKARVIELQQGLTRNIAMSPVNGGDGEMEKAQWLKEKLLQFGLSNIKDYNAPDERVSAKERPNFTVVVEGKGPRTLWVMGHLDVVPAGALELWNTDPFSLTVAEDGDTIYGRGVEDNQQAIVSAVLLAAELLEEHIIPDIAFGLLCVADEETSNAYGVDYLMEHFPDIVKEGDLVLVPDFGTEDGAMVEIAEKGVLWLEIVVSGKQCHASTPDQAVNTLMVAAEMISESAKIQDELTERDDLFMPNCSTITPTRILANVPNTNTISGQDTFYLDCRILPCYTAEQVYEKVKTHLEPIAAKYGAQLQINIQSSEPFTPPTPVDSEIVVKTLAAIKDVYGIDAKPGGIGGSTVASRFRMRNIPAVVWARVHPTYHMPNEKSKISHNINDAKVFAHILFNSI